MIRAFIDRRRLNRKSGGELAVYIVAFVVMAVFCFSYIFALLWAAFAATKTHTQIVLEPFKWHAVWHFDNYIKAFSGLVVSGVNIFGMIGNSLMLTFGGSALAILGCALMAYVIAKFDFFYKKALLAVNFVVMILPIVGSLPAQYRMYAALGFIDSYLILITYVGCFGANMLIILSFFRNLSGEYREAALIDGAGEYLILFRIMLPLAKGPIMALFVTQLVLVWNDYTTPLLFMPKMPTLATGIYMFRRQMVYRAHMEYLMAATVISALPPLILYICCSKTILTNMTLGGLKG